MQPMPTADLRRNSGRRYSGPLLTMASGFTPIGLSLRRIAPGQNDAIAADRQGVRCACDAPLWIAGSAQAGHGCFACITSGSTPDGNYKIVVATHRM